MAAECFGGVDPFFVVFDGLVSLCFVCVTQGAFAVAHDEELFYIVVLGAGVEAFEVGFVLCFVFEERVDIFDGVDAEITGFFGEIVGGDFVCKEEFVE